LIGLFGSAASIIGTVIAFNPQLLGNPSSQTNQIKPVEQELSRENQTLKIELKRVYKEKMIKKLEEYGLSSENENYNKIVDELNAFIDKYVDATGIENKKISRILIANRLLQVYVPEIVNVILETVFID